MTSPSKENNTVNLFSLLIPAGVTISSIVMLFGIVSRTTFAVEGGGIAVILLGILTAFERPYYASQRRVGLIIAVLGAAAIILYFKSQ